MKTENIEFIESDWTIKQAEKRFRKRGYKVIKNGWPDLLLLKDGHYKCVELKGPFDKLKPHQRSMHTHLRKMGIVVEVHYFKFFEVKL